MAADYRFLRKEKSVFIRLLQTEMQRQGGHNLSTEYLEKVAYKSGVSVHTIKAWLFGDTLQPQAITIQFVAEALECTLSLIRNDGTTIKGPNKNDKPKKQKPRARR